MENPNFNITEISDADRAQVAAFVAARWGAEKLVTRGKVHHASQLPGFICKQDNRIIGLLTYHIENDQCEIVTLDSIANQQGLGSLLVEKIKAVAKAQNCKRLWLVTTNDNLNAIRFYQKRGFEWLAIHVNSIEESRKLKPEIPLIGLNGIPIKHEIEFEMNFDK